MVLIQLLADHRPDRSQRMPGRYPGLEIGVRTQRPCAHPTRFVPLAPRRPAHPRSPKPASLSVTCNGYVYLREPASSLPATRMGVATLPKWLGLRSERSMLAAFSCDSSIS
jgi:hypothetical protein